MTQILKPLHMPIRSATKDQTSAKPLNKLAVKSTKKQTANHQSSKVTKPDTIELVATVHEIVPLDFYKRIQSSITWNLPHLYPDDYFVPEDLVGIGLWCDLTDDEKRMARACIAHLSETKVLPICTRDAKLDYPRFYVVA